MEATGCVPPTCTLPGDCPPDYYCQVDNPVTCVDGQGTCLPVLIYCQAPIAQVTCGCDGVTYPDACTLADAGERGSALGACDCIDNTDCDPLEYCNAVTCDGPGHCDPKPTDCDPGPGDITGCDQLTYDSVCAAAAAGVRVGGEPYPPFPF